MTLPPSEEDLVRAAQRGDRQAFAVLWEMYKGMVEGWIRRRSWSFSDEDREDLLAETCAVALKNCANFRGQSKFRTYLVGIAERTVRATIRTRTRRENILQPSDLPGVLPAVYAAQGSPEDLASEGELWHAICSALGVLPEELEIVTDFLLVDNLDPKLVAEVLSVPIGTVSNRFTRVKELFKKGLGDAWKAFDLDKSSADPLALWPGTLACARGLANGLVAHHCPAKLDPDEVIKIAVNLWKGLRQAGKGKDMAVPIRCLILRYVNGKDPGEIGKGLNPPVSREGTERLIAKARAAWMTKVRSCSKPSVPDQPELGDLLKRLADNDSDMMDFTQSTAILRSAEHTDGTERGDQDDGQ